MAILNLRASPACEGLPKNCARCGQDFLDYSDAGAMRVCPACKRLRINPPRDLPALLGQPLTAREVQIVDLVAAGQPNKEIAHRLHLGEGTIKTFMSVILAKTGKPNRTSLACWWLLKAWNASVMPH